VLRLTGFKTWGEFLEETTPEDRALTMESIRAWHDATEGAVR